MDEDGAIYLVSNWLAFFGIGDAGLENLILGVMPVEVEDSSL